MFKIGVKKVRKDEFENTIIHGIHISRYIASWYIAGGGQLKGRRNVTMFKNWLRHLGLDEDEVMAVFMFATNGKLELQDNAKEFIASEEALEKTYF